MMESRLLSCSSSKSKRHIKPSPSKEAQMTRNWAEIPEDVLQIIAQKASTTNMEYVHLRAVCKPWQQALTPHPHHLPCQVPWLMLPQLPMDTRQRLGTDADVSFYDLGQSRTHQFQLPYMSGKHIVGSSHGWFILEQHHRMSLFNPITRISIDLPSLDAPPTLLAGDAHSVPSNQHGAYRICVLKAILSCCGSKSDCIVVARFDPPCIWELGFCRIRDTCWTGLKKQDQGRRLVDFTFQNNQIYTVNHKKEISGFDLQSLAMWTFPTKINFFNLTRDKINLVDGDANSRGPLVIRTSEYLGKRTIYAYKWCHDSKIWLRVKDIGKRVLFLNEMCSVNLQWDEKPGNIVYYNVRRSLSVNSFRVGIIRANLGSGKEVPGNSSPVEVFTSISELPVWITPSLI